MKYQYFFSGKYSYCSNASYRFAHHLWCQSFTEIILELTTKTIGLKPNLFVLFTWFLFFYFVLIRRPDFSGMSTWIIYVSKTVHILFMLKIICFLSLYPILHKICSYLSRSVIVEFFFPAASKDVCVFWMLCVCRWVRWCWGWWSYPTPFLCTSLSFLMWSTSGFPGGLD